MSFPTHFTRKRRIVIRSFPTLLTKRRRNASAVLLITNSLKLYIKNAGDFEKLTAQAAQLDENARMLRYLRGRMKLNDGVVEPLFRERFGQELPQEFSTLLDKAVENGLAQRTADGWMPTLEGLFRGEVL